MCGGQRTTWGNGVLAPRGCQRINSGHQAWWQHHRPLSHLDGSHLKKKKKPNKSSTTCSPSAIPCMQLSPSWRLLRCFCDERRCLESSAKTWFSSHRRSQQECSSGLYSALSETFWARGQSPWDKGQMSDSMELTQRGPNTPKGFVCKRELKRCHSFHSCCQATRTLHQWIRHSIYLGDTVLGVSGSIALGGKAYKFVSATHWFRRGLFWFFMVVFWFCFGFSIFK